MSVLDINLGAVNHVEEPCEQETNTDCHEGRCPVIGSPDLSTWPRQPS